MPSPEAPLWAVLDRLGLLFRLTRQDLIAQHGTRPSLWVRDMAECVLPAEPMVQGLTCFYFQFGTQPGAVDDLKTAPDWLTASYRVHADADRNFADLLGSLSALFGPGEPGQAFNTLERRWAFGRALLVARSFPPRWNHLPNRRHAADPGSATEASVALTPGWLPSLTTEQVGWLSKITPLGSPDPSRPSPGQTPPLRHRWPEGLGRPPTPVYGLSADGAGFVVILDLGYVLALPRAWLVEVRRDVSTPARGPGGTTLSVSALRSGQLALPPQRIVLNSGPPDTLAAVARRLADTLSLPLVETSWPDD